MKVSKSISTLILFGPTAAFLYAARAAAKSPWALVLLLAGAMLLNTTAVLLLAWSERRWPANLGMRRPQPIASVLRENSFKVIGLTYLSAAIGWRFGQELHRIVPFSSFPQREWIVAQVIACLFIVDFFDYWAHRIQHRYEWLWKRHAIHHSVNQFSIFGAAKISWLDTPFVVFPGFLCLGVLGIGSIAAAATMISWFALTTMLHANADLSLGVLDYVFQVPAVHHHHHEIGFDEALSFGGVFIIFDHMFGTGAGPGDFASEVGIGPRHP